MLKTKKILFNQLKFKNKKNYIVENKEQFLEKQEYWVFSGRKEKEVVEEAIIPGFPGCCQCPIFT